MKKLSHDEISSHFEMHNIVRERLDLQPFVYELSGHGRVTMDVSYDQRTIVANFNESAGRATAHELVVFEIDNATGRKRCVMRN